MAQCHARGKLRAIIVMQRGAILGLKTPILTCIEENMIYTPHSHYSPSERPQLHPTFSLQHQSPYIGEGTYTHKYMHTCIHNTHKHT